VAATAWLLGHDPTVHIVVVSYNEVLAEKHSGDARRLMESDYRAHRRQGAVRQTAPFVVIDNSRSSGGERLSTPRAHDPA
jgi:hypothetical protein